MTQYRWTAESGLADNTTLTSSPNNTGGTAGPAFTQVARDTVTPSIMRYRNANPSHGTQSLELQPASAVSNYVAWLDTAGTNTKHWAGVAYVKAAAGPTAEDYIMQLRSGATANVVVCSLKVTTGGLLRMFNSTAGASVLQTGTTIPWALAQSIRFEWDVLVAASPTTTNGIFTASWFLGDSPTASGTITSSAFDLGSAVPTQTRFGRPAAITGTWPAFWDDLGMDTAASGFMGPVPVAPPTVSFTQNTVVKADFTASTPTNSGDALTYSIVQVGTPVSTPQEIIEGVFLITPDASATLTYTVTVTEAGGSSATQTVTIPPLSATSAAGHAQILRRVAGVWTT